MSGASFKKWHRSGPILGEHLRMSRPPLLAEPEQPVPAATQFTKTVAKMNVLKLSWPKQASSIDLERQIEVRKWKSIIEAVGPERCNLSRNLLELKTEDEKWNVLLAVFHTRAPATHRKHAGAMNLYMRWCQSYGFGPFP